MNKTQIRLLAESIAKTGEAAPETFDWIIKNLSKPQLKYFAARLAAAVINFNVKIYYAGAITEEAKQNLHAVLAGNKTLNTIFADKTPHYVKDDAIIGGIKLESGDYSLDYSLTARAAQIIKNLKESL